MESWISYSLRGLFADAFSVFKVKMFESISNVNAGSYNPIYFLCMYLFLSHESI